MKNQPLIQKIKNAGSGIIFTLKTEKNFRFHCLAAVAVIIALSVLQPAVIWWAMIILCIGLIMASELINTAIETLLDYMHPDIHPEIGKVKDIMAGMVLVLSLVSVIIAVLAVIDTLG